MLNKSLNVKWNLDSISEAIHCRLLAKYKKNQNSYTVDLTEDISNSIKCKKINICNNEKLTKGKNKQSNGNSLSKKQYYTEIMDYNNGMFDGKHFHFQKKWIKKKDFDDFVEKKRRICDIDLKKIKFRNYGFGFALFFIFLLLGIGIPISPGLTFLEVKWKTIQGNPLGIMKNMKKLSLCLSNINNRECIFLYREDFNMKNYDIFSDILNKRTYNA
ncbi:Plasmodium exported protein (Pm-fam-a like), unknown function [Plasmodium malariae]|uniref:Uncharacterized protein n=1 Tax=Plasmodium malariae TaxID=5858 RepID=A0A1A8WW44_PLAMA|nr:Plasmodium exported protein (Pm-fam-a like), unknown function [Plasmodium malariae]